MISAVCNKSTLPENQSRSRNDKRNCYYQLHRRKTNVNGNNNKNKDKGKDRIEQKI